MKKLSILFVIIAFWGCDKDSSSTGPSADCTTLGATFTEKFNAVESYRRSDSYDSSDTDLKATCDGMCAELVTAAQALLDNSCEWPEVDDEEAYTGPATQEQVDGFESGFCGDNGVCN